MTASENDPEGASPAASPSAPLAGRAHAPWGEVILLAGLSMFGSVAMDMYLPALPRMAQDLHATAQAAQGTITIFLCGLAVGQLAFGPLSDRLGRRAPLLTGVALFLAASALCAAAPSVGVLTAARLLQALGACSGMVIARAVVRDRYDDHEVLHVYALLSLVFAIAPIAAPIIGGLVLRIAGWRSIFAVQAAFGLATGAVAWRRLTESRSEATRLKAVSERPLSSYLALLREPLFTGYFLTGALSGAALFSYITAAPQVVITELHIPPAHFGWVFGINAVGLIGAGQLNARLARRIAGDRLLRFGLVAALAASLLLVLCAWTGRGGALGVLGPLFLVLSSLGFSQPNAQAAAMSVDRHRGGASAALIGAGFFGVGSLAGTATSLAAGTGAQAMALVVTASLALALAAYLGLVRPALRARAVAEAVA